MALEKYKKKRDFKQTSEPKAKVAKSSGALRFVVQKHAATRLHYDFRLELNGVLKSWAVPKGPSLNPKNKRLAMMVEDHPLDYQNFEGVIPEGNYGAGEVIVWDKGTYRILASKDRKTIEKAVTEELKKGDIKIFLDGEKLKGEFALVRIKDPKQKNAWLLIKHNDDYARITDDFSEFSVVSGKSLDQLAHSGGEVETDGIAKADMPHDVIPQLSTLIDEPFDDKDWVFELKHDGYRAMAEIYHDKAKLYSRNNISFNDKYPEIVESLKKIKAEAVIDGEVVALDKKGNASFQNLQEYSSTSGLHLMYYVFDILYFNGFDLRSMPLLKRKEILKKLLPKISNIKYSDHIPENGKKLFKTAVKNGVEGVIGKRKDSFYQAGVRSKDWVKIKATKTQEAVICGYTLPKGKRSVLGALVLGVYERESLKYIGNVGTGFTENTLELLEKKLKALRRKEPTLKTDIELPKGVTWVEPKLICEVTYTEWTKDKLMRHPSFIGLREDKNPIDVGYESAKKETNVKRKVELSNLKKIYWPEEKYTKGDLIEYYENVAEYLLPHLKDRPESLHRNPNGIIDKGFFQKNIDEKVPEWLETIPIVSESKNEEINFMLCQNVETLLFMANWGCIELNPWSSSVGSLDNPDYCVFDLDPLDTPFTNVVKVALEVKKILDEIKVPAFVKTSGSKGMHIFIPLKKGYMYEQSQQFAKVIELIVNSRLPDITSLERMPDQRRGKVYLDYLQNSKGKTMASIYSARPKPGATASTPLDWSEVNAKLDPKIFTIKTLPKRLQKEGDLWKDIFETEVDLIKSIELLSKMIK